MTTPGIPRTFRCEILTPEETVLKAEALSAVFPAADGLVGVLPGRAPLLAALGAGRLTVRREGRRHRFFVAGGVAHMRDNVLTILTERCQPVSQ